jgi:hypothetical protein
MGNVRTVKGACGLNGLLRPGGAMTIIPRGRDGRDGACEIDAPATKYVSEFSPLRPTNGGESLHADRCESEFSTYGSFLFCR